MDLAAWEVLEERARAAVEPAAEETTACQQAPAAAAKAGSVLAEAEAEALEPEAGAEALEPEAGAAKALATGVAAGEVSGWEAEEVGAQGVAAGCTGQTYQLQRRHYNTRGLYCWPPGGWS